ncbi:hypothetical protein [Chromobacterium haemolyticum]|uniref:hypothetical protein n=1 Tax=Chromobacterium haemolyticum TaxID=394935 RepID=UPI0013B390B5|nr:hypothetical protein [Chromobacterium haemolyticum]
MHGTQAGFVDLLRTRSKSAALREALHGEYTLKMLMYHSTIKSGQRHRSAAISNMQSRV